MINADVRKILESSMWDLATSSKDGEPNVVPVAFKDVGEDGRLADSACLAKS